MSHPLLRVPVISELMVMSPRLMNGADDTGINVDEPPASLNTNNAGIIVQDLPASMGASNSGINSDRIHRLL